MTARRLTPRYKRDDDADQSPSAKRKPSSSLVKTALLKFAANLAESPLPYMYAYRYKVRGCVHTADVTTVLLCNVSLGGARRTDARRAAQRKPIVK